MSIQRLLGTADSQRTEGAREERAARQRRDPPLHIGSRTPASEPPPGERREPEGPTGAPSSSGARTARRRAGARTGSDSTRGRRARLRVPSEENARLTLWAGQASRHEIGDEEAV